MSADNFNESNHNLRPDGTAQFGWEGAGATDVGNIRSINEDAVGLRPDIGLWVVADGMGGHESGEVASAAVVEAMNHVAYPANLDSFVADVKRRLEHVNSELVKSASMNKTSGSTVVALLAYGNQCACLWVGDSRAYRLRKNTMHAMTRDHSYVEELLAEGKISLAESENHPQGNVITRAIGAQETVDVDVGIFDLEDGDRYLLCSDGLYRDVLEAELSTYLEGVDCNTAAQVLINTALQRGGGDNISVVVVDFGCEL